MNKIIGGCAKDTIIAIPGPYQCNPGTDHHRPYGHAEVFQRENSLSKKVLIPMMGRIGFPEDDLVQPTQVVELKVFLRNRIDKRSINLKRSGLIIEVVSDSGLPVTCIGTRHVRNLLTWLGKGQNVIRKQMIVRKRRYVQNDRVVTGPWTSTFRNHVIVEQGKSNPVVIHGDVEERKIVCELL
jgi:hypothetical protein